MPSVSKQQQKLFGLVRALQKGDVDSSKVSKQVKDLAKKMKKSDVKAYASTKHDDLPKKVKREDLRKLVKKYGAKRVKESVFAVMGKTRKDGYREPEKPNFEYDPEKVNESVNEYEYAVGDMVKDVNPTCPHNGAIGKVKSINPKSVVFIVKNKGDNYEPGDVLDKTHDQMEKIKENKQEKLQIAKTILSQLGGNRFIAMTGAKSFGYDSKGSVVSLQFKIGRNAKQVNIVRINYIRGKDLYEMNFYKGTKLLKKVSNVYADQLRKIFTKHTGMYTSL